VAQSIVEGPDPLEVIAAQLDAVFESAPFGIGLFDLQVRHVRVNRVLEEMNGLPASELLGRRPAELHPSVGEEAELLYREVMQSGRPRRDVLLTGETGSRPGDIRHWNATFFPVRHDHEVIGLCVVVADVTTEHRLTVALAASEEAHRRLAEDLQRSLLPHALPRLAGVELGSVYRPSGVVASVGGDFYDLVELDGASCLLVIGDVEGTGPAAASLTAAARYAIRATAVRTTDPAELLRIANEVLLREGAPNGTCTVACVLATRVGQRIELRAASSGHPLPLILRSGSGGVEELGAPGPLLGILPDVHPPVSSATLAAGDVLVLYTDGVTEARYRTPEGTLEVFGEERLRSVLTSSTPAGAAEIAERVETAVATFESGHPADDLAVLVLKVVVGD
jgi:sigma-B regulation protein RsbU (phosphoserine phosphatase)